MKLAAVPSLIWEAYLAFGQDRAPRLAAAIAYYAVFAIAPLLLLAVLVAGRFLSDGTVLAQLFGTADTQFSTGLVSQNLGSATAEFLNGLLDTDALTKGSATATALASVTLFLGATGLFVQIQDALNSLWGADPVPPMNIGQVVVARLKSFVMILAIGVLLIAFLGLNTYLSAIAQRLGDTIGAGAFFVRAGTLLLSTAFLAPVFAAIYKVLPDVKLQWHEVWVGGIFTSTLFNLGQLLIGLYLGQAAPGSVFGAAASLVILLLWIYYSAMIFFFGAEVTWVYSQKFGTHAGGAANVAKKVALAAQGAEISTAPSAQEREALAAQDALARDARGRVLGVGVPRLPRVLREVPRHGEGRLLPSVRGTVWNAVLAVLAVPAVMVLRLLGIAGKRRDQ